MNKFNLFICGSILLVLSVSCSMMKDSKIAEPAVENFHDQFNAKAFSDIYAQAGDQMKGAATEKQLTDLLDAVHRKLGTYKSSKEQSFNVNAGPLSSTVTMVYDTEFSDGKATEQFVFSVKGETAKLEGYNINSPDLITK
jgi:Protein of unknown function (DUF3887)